MHYADRYLGCSEVVPAHPHVYGAHRGGTVCVAGKNTKDDEVDEGCKRASSRIQMSDILWKDTLSRTPLWCENLVGLGPGRRRNESLKSPLERISNTQQENA